MVCLNWNNNNDCISLQYSAPIDHVIVRKIHDTTLANVLVDQIRLHEDECRKRLQGRVTGGHVTEAGMVSIVPDDQV